MDGIGPSISFWILAAVTLVAGGGVMGSRSLFHAVLFLILTFVGIAGFFVLLSAEFLAMAQIIIYVGAISVLVLFAVLLTPRASRQNGETKMLLPGALLCVCLAAIFLFVIQDANWHEVATSPDFSTTALGNALLQTWVLPFEIASVLLTAALVGAILLARTPQEETEDALA